MRTLPSFLTKHMERLLNEISDDINRIRLNFDATRDDVFGVILFVITLMLTGVVLVVSK